MFIACIVLAVLLAAMMAASARLKLTRDERAVAMIHGIVGVPLAWFPRLAAAELAAGAGALAGLAVASIGIAAAIGGIVYFVGAVAGHLRVRDRALAPPIFLLAMFIAYLVTRRATT